MRRKDQGSPKIVTLAQTKYHEKDPYLSKEKLENASLLEQMKRWLNIPKSRQRRNETNDETFDSRRETGSAYEISPHRNVKFNSPSPFSDYEAEAAPSSPSVCSLASGITPEQDRLPSAVSQGISDTVTYNCMNRSDVRRRIQNLKRLKRNKRKTVVKLIVLKYLKFVIMSQRRI